MSENGTFRQGIGNDHQEKFEKKIKLFMIKKFRSEKIYDCPNFCTFF